MPPRISPNRGVPNSRGRPSRGDHRGGANRGSQFGGPSSINTDAAATPSETPESISSATGGRPSANRVPIATNNSTASRGQPPGNRGRGRGRGASRGAAPGTPSGVETTPVTPTASETGFPQNPQSATRGQPFRGRGGYRGSARGSPFDSPSSVRGRSPRGGRGGVAGGFVAGSSDTTGLPTGIPGKSEKTY